MQGWVMMWHRSWADWTQAHGDLVGGFYSDIESACRAIAGEKALGKIVSVEYENNGEKALITTDKGNLFGAFLMKMPMREDVPTKW